MRVRAVKIRCGTLAGIEAIPVTIEATMRGEAGTPRILGRVDAVVREAYHRILSAFVASGVPSPRGVPTLNFLPASVPKSGSGFDLPMALALAAAGGLVPAERIGKIAALGEVSLAGRILPVRGAVAVALAARAAGCDQMLAHPDNARAAAMVPDLQVLEVVELAAALRWLHGDETLPIASPGPQRPPTSCGDLADLRGLETPKRALVVAAAGRHNVLLSGPPGSGKTALARRLAGLLPELSTAEALEVLQIHTAHGPGTPSTSRPFRAPHHSSSAASLLGGGSDPRPGEVTLAHRGVLFLDELPEFSRAVLEGLRQPLEEHAITIGRARHTVRMPADCLVIAAMNPCPCGFLGHPQRPCVCTPHQRNRYAARISGPLRDRIDLRVEVPTLPPDRYAEPRDEQHTSERARERVLTAIARQIDRGLGANGRLTDDALDRALHCDAAARLVLEQILRGQGLSGRARVRLLRVARTVADLQDRDAIEAADLWHAARLRGE